MKKLLLASLLSLALVLCACGGDDPGNTVPAEGGVTVTDMAGRTVTVPAGEGQIYTTGQVSTILLYTLAPDALLGWNYALNDAEKAFILPEYHDLPVFGMGDAVNPEAVAAAAPRFVLAGGPITDSNIADAEALQAQLGIPVVMVSDALTDCPEAFRLIGRLIGREDQAEALAAFAEKTFADMEAAVATVPADQRVSVYYGNGEQSLNTSPAGSVSSQVIEMAGAVNVAALEAGDGSRMDISKEQILAWDPDVVILNGEPKSGFSGGEAVAAFCGDPDYARLTAVEKGRVYACPKAPFSWIDRPPGPNRLIGLYWAFAGFYPDYADFDIRDITAEFYRLFYHTELTGEQVDSLLAAE